MKTTVKNNLEAIKEYLNSLDNQDTVSAWNEYCQDAGSGDDEIYTNDEEFFNTFFSKVIDAVRAVTFGEYNYSDEYVIFNGYGNLESFNDPSEHVSIDEMANAIFNGDFCPYDIELEDEEDEEEEEGGEED